MNTRDLSTVNPPSLAEDNSYTDRLLAVANLRAEECQRYATEIHRLRAAIAEAVTELSDALHTEEHDADGRPLGVCVMCGYRNGSWPCVSRMVADDLAEALGRDDAGPSN